MADFRTGGLKAVHYSDTGASSTWTKITGDIAEADGLDVAVIEQQITNSVYQSGGTYAPSVRFTDHTDKATLTALALGNNRAKKFFAFEYFDGTIYKTTEAVYPRVRDLPKALRNEGDALWELAITLDADEPITKIASLT